MIAPVVGVGRVPPDILDNQPHLKVVLGSMAIARTVERFRRQEALDGMLEGDDEKFDKLK